MDFIKHPPKVIYSSHCAEFIKRLKIILFKIFSYRKNQLLLRKARTKGEERTHQREMAWDLWITGKEYKVILMSIYMTALGLFY